MAEEALEETESLIENAQYHRIGFLIVHFKTEPVMLSVGAFRPRYDVNGKEIQDITV